jgi:hypothetical protein
MVGRREVFECGGARGFRYGELPAELAVALPRWLERGVLGKGEGQVLKTGAVWRVGDLVVKLYAPREGFDAWRPSPALRAAELAAELPVRTPAPIVALEQRRDPRRGAGVLVSEFVEGRWLHRLWDDDPAARAAFPGFMAAMHKARVLHGDLNARNLLWNGREWVLLDLDGLRVGMQALFPERLIEAQWVRLVATLRLRPGVRELFLDYAREMATGDAEARWRRIEGGAAGLRAEWDALRGAGPADEAVSE